MSQLAINSNKNDRANWTVQVAKSLGFVLSSLGIGWAIQHLWKGADVLPGKPLAERSPLALDLAKPSCAMGLFLGGAGSALSGSPLPLGAGASLCLPSASAESTIPDETITIIPHDAYFQKQAEFKDDMFWVKTSAKALAALAVAATGGLAAPAAAVLGVMGSEALDGIFAPLPNNHYLKQGLEFEYNKWRQKVATDPRLANDKSQQNLVLARGLMRGLEDPRIEPIAAEMTKKLLNNLLSVEEINTANLAVAERELRNLGSKLQGVQSQQASMQQQQGFMKQQQESLKKTTDFLVQETGDLKQKHIATQRSVKKLINRMDKAEAGIEMNAQEMQSLREDVAASFEGVAQHLTQMGQRMEETQTLAQNTAILTKHLVEQAMMVSTKGFQASQKVMALDKEMHELQSKGDVAQALGKSTELKKAIQEEQQLREEFDQTLDGISAGIGIVSLVAKFAGGPKLANTLSTVGQSAITIAKSIGALAGFGSAAASVTSGFAAMGPIGAISGAIGAIFSLFMDSGPTIDEQILQAVGELSKTLNEVRKEMHFRFDHLEKRVDMRFDRLEKILENQLKYIEARFDHLLNVMTQFHKQSVEKFLEIKGDTSQIKKLADSILSDLNKLEKQMLKVPAIQYLDKYKELRHDALSYHRLHPLPEKMSDSEQDHYYKGLSNWAKVKMASEFFTGALTTADFKSVAEAVKSSGIYYNVQSLANLASKHLQLRQINSIPNPQRWADATESFLEFLWRTPEFKLKSNHQPEFDDIRATGARFQSFVHEVQSSHQLFETLIKKYRESLINVQHEIKKIVGKVIQTKDENFDESKLKKAVEEVKLNDLKPKAKQIAESSRILVETTKKSYSDQTLEGLALLPAPKAVPKTMKTQMFHQSYYGFANTLQVLLPPQTFHHGGKGVNQHVDKIRHKLRACELTPELIKQSRDKWNGHLREVPKEYLTKLASAYNEIPKAQTNYRTELHTFLSTLSSEAQTMDPHLQKFAEINESPERAYLTTQRVRKAFGKVFPWINQLPQLTPSQLKQQEISDDTYHYLLDHLTPGLREEINSLLRETFLETTASPLNAALQEVDHFHTLIEAYTRIGFHSDFHQDFVFRTLFEKLWSYNALRHSILSWNATEPEKMPYIQITDSALPPLEDLQMGIFDKITDYAIAKNDAVEISKQKTGHNEVDEAQSMLHFYEMMFMDKAERDEL